MTRRSSRRCRRLKPMFKRLYLETSELVAAGWPRVSADLENVLKTTAAIEVPVLLPAGVQLELENSWSRERGERTGAVWSKIRSLEAHFSGVRDMKIALDLPDP